MRTVLKQLPPMSTLRPFEAAARHENFTEAADELFVTPAAVSKQVRLLEDHLGVILFVRNGRNLTLTAAGRDLYHMISKGLSHVAEGTSQLRRSHRDNRVAIAMRSSFANHFLAPRLVDLHAAFPELEFKFHTTEQNPADMMDTVDLGIVLGHEPQPHTLSEHLITEVIAPVCSPSYLARNPDVRTITDLPAKNLLHLGPDAWKGLNWDRTDWPVFFDHFGVAHDTTLRGSIYNNYELLINATVAGLGIGIAWQYLVDPFVRSGQLVHPVPERYLLGRRLYLLCRQEQASRDMFRRLRAWFLDQAADFR